MAELLNEDDLSRARKDPVFRQRFYADHLDRLLDKLNDMRKHTDSDPLRAKQIKEGVELAVKLADRLNSKDKSGQAA